MSRSSKVAYGLYVQVAMCLRAVYFGEGMTTMHMQRGASKQGPTTQAAKASYVSIEVQPTELSIRDDPPIIN